MVVCVRVNNTFYSIICTFASILKLLDLFFPCFPSVTRRSDIDECSSGSHDCHQNATCVNTAGHYDCICKPGLTGNGRNCSGEAIIFFPFVKRQPELEKIQDLPTRGVYAVEHFTINANRFLAFANYKSYIEGHTTDSHLQAELFNWKFFPLPGCRVGNLKFNFAC